MVKSKQWAEGDIAWFKQLVEEDTAEIDDLKKSLTRNNEEYRDLIKGHQDFLAFVGMEQFWYEGPFVVAPYDLVVLLLVMCMGAREA